MTMLGEGSKDTRRRAPIDEMVAAGQSEADVRRVLEIFADPDRRLITLAADKEGRTIAEVAHEALFDHWSELRHGSIRIATTSGSHVASRARSRNGSTAGRPKGMLWRPPLLDLLRGYARDKAGDMPAAQLAFFKASESQHRRNIWTRRAGIAAAISVLLILAGGLYVYSRQQAQLAHKEAVFALQQVELRRDADEAKNEAVQRRPRLPQDTIAVPSRDIRTGDQARRRDERHSARAGSAPKRHDRARSTLRHRGGCGFASGGAGASRVGGAARPRAWGWVGGVQPGRVESGDRLGMPARGCGTRPAGRSWRCCKATRIGSCRRRSARTGRRW